jgi:hypothetical protein
MLNHTYSTISSLYLSRDELCARVIQANLMGQTLYSWILSVFFWERITYQG